MKLRSLLVGRIAATATVIGLALFPARANQESCTSLGRTVEVSGSFSHYKIAGGPAISGANPGEAAAFQEEIWGSNFTITVPRLPAGRYSVIIGAAEVYCDGANQRVFDILLEGRPVVTNLDLFAVAGGKGKVVYLTNQVEHFDDSLRGPLKVTFHAQQNNAKFNTLEIQDATGVPVVAIRAAQLVDTVAVAASRVPEVAAPEIWRDASQPVQDRVNDLIRRMSLTEKVQQIQNSTPAIPRLGIPAYDFWNEALHGVARNGIATVFPQAIGMAATWDAPLIKAQAQAIATEARAKYNEHARTHNGDSAIYTGLTMWSPNINIFRDPRWGRGQETYGEDPFLTGTLGVGFIQGLQGDDPKYVKAMACAKHFAVHSGPESSRHSFDVSPAERDLYETYLPQFEMAVREGKVKGFMGAYNSLSGKPACADSWLLQDVLRGQWGFDGYVVSDCGAIHDIFANHKFVATPEAAAAAAVKAGCNICCGGDYWALLHAVQMGLISEPEIDAAVAHALTARFQLGLFDPAAEVPFSTITLAANDTPEHRALALKVACESLVLLKNDGVLPLNVKKLKRIAVIGANAASVNMLLGNYNGTPSHPISILDGIRAAAGPGVTVTYDPGCPLVVAKDGSNQPTEEMLAAAVTNAREAEVVVYVGGISPDLEGEEFGGVSPYDGFSGGDRVSIELPPVQERLLQRLHAVGKPVVLVNCSGSAIAMPWAAQHLSAILQAWYPGQEGGRAVAKVLFGEYNPAGRLPVTFYGSTRDLPAFEDYSMSNRTYRYFSGQPLFAFGHGLSYTKFNYGKARLNAATLDSQGTITVSFQVKNTGKLAGEEVPQVYFRRQPAAPLEARLTLCGFSRIQLAAGQSTVVTIQIPTRRLRIWDAAQIQYVVVPGDYELLVGAASDDIRTSTRLKIRAN